MPKVFSDPKPDSDCDPKVFADMEDMLNDMGQTMANRLEECRTEMSSMPMQIQGLSFSTCIQLDIFNAITPKTISGFILSP